MSILDPGTLDLLLSDFFAENLEIGATLWATDYQREDSTALEDSAGLSVNGAVVVGVESARVFASPFAQLKRARGEKGVVSVREAGGGRKRGLGI